MAEETPQLKDVKESSRWLRESRYARDRLGHILDELSGRVVHAKGSVRLAGKYVALVGAALAMTVAAGALLLARRLLQPVGRKRLPPRRWYIARQR